MNGNSNGSSKGINQKKEFSAATEEKTNKFREKNEAVEGHENGSLKEDKLGKMSNCASDNCEKEMAVNEGSVCKGSCSGRLACACVAVCLVAGCAIFEYFFNHEKYCELAKNNASLTALVQEDSEKLKSLEQRVETLEKGVVQMKNVAGSASVTKARANWKVWVALKNKLEEGEAFEEELNAFESTFAYDQDLVKMVKDAIGAAETESQINDDTVVDAVKKYMNKVVSVRKINNSKLIEISGYVITSIEGVTDK